MTLIVFARETNGFSQNKMQWKFHLIYIKCSSEKKAEKLENFRYRKPKTEKSFLIMSDLNSSCFFNNSAEKMGNESASFISFFCQLVFSIYKSVRFHLKLICSFFRLLCFNLCAFLFIVWGDGEKRCNGIDWSEKKFEKSFETCKFRL